MKLHGTIKGVWASVVLLISMVASASVAVADTSPPATPVKLVFIHHSCGENWLSDVGGWNDKAGGLGAALMANNYFVSDTNYGWGPSYVPEPWGDPYLAGNIGDFTDTGFWWDWFRGATSAVYLNALYNESDQHADYARLATDPGGENEIVMFKSCYPNSALWGNPSDSATVGENPMRGTFEDTTVANAKGVYNDLLQYFASRHEEKLFIMVTPPPLTLQEAMAGGVSEQEVRDMLANGRAVAHWLVHDWLDDYPYDNVAVFDFYNVLTSNGGSAVIGDAEQESGNHHRILDGHAQHIQTVENDFAAYSEDGYDSHPSSAGNQKATAEFVPLLNYYYNEWKKTSGPDDASEKLYFPHIASNLQWETEICVLNPHSSASLTGVLKAYADDGASISQDIPISLAPFARREIVVSNEFIGAEAIGYIVLEISSGEASGYIKFWQEGRYRVAIPAVSEVNTGDVYLSHIASNDQWWTGVSLVNTTSVSKTLSFEFNDGTIANETLAPGQHRAFTIRQFFGGTPPNGVESATIKNASGVVGLALFGTNEGKGNYLSGVLLRDDAVTRLRYPHVASNSSWWTGIVAYNPGAVDCQMTVQPYRSDGSTLQSKTVTIGARQKYIGTVANLDLPAGTEWFEISASTPITGFELFGTNDGNQLAGYTGVNINGASGVFPKIEDEVGGWTGIAFVNIENGPATVTLVACDNSGTPVASETIVLGAYAKRVDVAESLFSESIASARCIWYSSDREIVGFQLNGSADGMMLDGLPGLLTTHGVPEIPDTPSPQPGDLVQLSDFQYIGAFRLPGGDDPPQTFAYGGNAMTFNPDGDAGNSDQYQGSLFVTGHDRLAYGVLPDGDQIAEIAIPEPAVSDDPATLPAAEFVQVFHDVTAGYFTDMEEIPKVGIQYLDHPDTGAKIHLCWGQHLQPQDAPSHAWFNATLDSPDFQGVWFIGNQNLYSVNGYLFDIPADWADTHLGGRYLATGRMRDGGQGGMGPTLFAYRPWQTDGSAPPSGTRLTEIPLLLYENATATEEIVRSLDGYQHADEWEGGAWLTTPSGKSAVLFAGTKGTGTKYWYGYIHPDSPDFPCVDSHVTDFETCRLADGSPCPSQDKLGCCDENDGDCVTYRGWWSTRFDAQFILYDPADLAEVAAGNMESWEPQPYAVMDIDDHLYLSPPEYDEIMVGFGQQRRYRIGAVAYDRTNGFLYVLEQYADGGKPVVHVWRVS